METFYNAIEKKLFQSFSAAGISFVIIALFDRFCLLRKNVQLLTIFFFLSDNKIENHTVGELKCI